jgi:hypothetical protein
VGWEVEAPSPGSYLIEPLPFARISTEYVGYFFSPISPPLFVL